METPIPPVNHESSKRRFQIHRELADYRDRNQPDITPTIEVNNHVHTSYSFSPYTPTAAAFEAWKAGLQAVGIVDHDSIAGGMEMIEAARALSIGSTVGFELRVNMSGTGLEGLRLNSPDSQNIAYIVIHGVPAAAFPVVGRFLEPIHEARNQRNRRMLEALNDMIGNFGIGKLDFAADVVPLSSADEGGSITERHLLFALVHRILASEGRGPGVVRLLAEKMGINLPQRIKEFLEDEHNPHYLYDLLGVLKSEYTPRFYVQPDENECVSVKDAVALAQKTGAIPAYAYLGDVGESPTGDKKAQKFEDEFLDSLIPEVKRLGFQAVTYMPPRNTMQQLKRIMRLARENELMEISGVDINTSRQSFHCRELEQPEFSHLIDATWALIAHEKLTNCSAELGLFHPDNPLSGLDLAERMERYADIGRQHDRRDPEAIRRLADFA
ncbi:MAG: PHP domain-containing protein [Spirochaetales bacterium]|nr:PHP domain-containing protein [Spirochaetales bacterium]MCF7937427.1 PHP domain-containing protein [Spirochaetales bacterium]